MALSTLALLVMSGVTAGAEPEISEAEEAVQAIDSIVGGLRADAVGVTDVDAAVVIDDLEIGFSGDAKNGVSVTTPGFGELAVGLPFADTADGGEIFDGSLVYENNNGSTTTPLVQDDGSVQILTTITDANAPTEYRYTIDLAPGATLLAAADGGVAILDKGGDAIGFIAPPWALDANGAVVPTHYEIDGGTLVQVVSHLTSDTVYPVIADPKISFGWKIYYKYSKSETKTYAGYTPYGTIASGICPFLLLGGPWSVAACVAALEVFAVSLDRTFNSAASHGKCVEISLPYYPSIVAFAAQMRWKEVSC